MVYNKKKSILEKIAGILNVIYAFMLVLTGISLIVFGIYLFVLGLVVYQYTDFSDYSFMVQGIIYFIASLIALIPIIFNIVFSAKLISNPEISDEALSKRKNARIVALVFMIIFGNWISAILLIIALNMPDLENANSNNNVNTINLNKEIDFFAKVKELKNLRLSNLLDDKAFKDSIDKLLDEYLNNNSEILSVNN